MGWEKDSPFRALFSPLLLPLFSLLAACACEITVNASLMTCCSACGFLSYVSSAQLPDWLVQDEAKEVKEKVVKYIHKLEFDQDSRTYEKVRKIFMEVTAKHPSKKNAYPCARRHRRRSLVV